MKTYTFTLQAGAPLILPFGGRQFFLVEAAYPLDAEFFDKNNQNAGEKLEGIESGTWAEPLDGFSSLRLTSATTQSVKFVITTGRAGIFRISGNVSVMDGSRARTVAGLAFMGAAGGGGTVGQFAHSQLMNPTGSGVRVTLQQMILSTQMAGTMHIAHYNTPLAGGISQQGASKYSGGANSIAQIRNESNVANLLGPTMLVGLVVGTGTGLIIQFREPIVLLPGKGCAVQHTVTAATFNITWEFLEEPNV